MDENKNELVLIQQKQLAELEQLRVVDELQMLKQRFSKYYGNLEGAAPHDHKWVIAFNHAVGRTNDQSSDYSLLGMESIADGVRDYKVLANNNMRTGSITRDIGDDTTVYVVVDKHMVGQDLTTKTIEQRIKEATEDYELFGTPYTLMLYFNTTDYNIYTQLKSEVDAIPGIKYQAINEVKKSLIPDDALVIDFVPAVACEDIISNFITAMSIPPLAMRNPVFIADDIVIDNPALDILDISLIASRSISKLIVDPGTSALMAREATSMWLDPQEYKFFHEHVHDFFNSPSAVQIMGLSYFAGIITERLMTVYAVELNEGHEREKQFTINSAAHIGPADDPEMLHKLLLADSRNTRNNLFTLDGVYHRLERTERTLKFAGNNANYPEGFMECEVRDNFDNVSFLTPFFLKAYYQQMMQVADKGFSLPPQFDEYLLRKASLRNVPIAGQEWFRRVNSRIGQVLEALEEFRREAILRKYISPVTGFRTTEINLDWGDLK